MKKQLGASASKYFGANMCEDQCILKQVMEDRKNRS